MKKTMLLAGAISASLFVAACGEDLSQPAASGAEAEAESAEMTELASVQRDDGSVYTFYEGEPGEIMLHTVSDRTEPEMIRRLDAGEVSFSGLYEELSGQEAPARLVDAQTRSDALKQLREAEGGDFEEAHDSERESFSTGMDAAPTNQGVGTISQAISAGDFQDDFCSSDGWSFSYCWPDTGGNPWVQQKSHTFRGYMAAVNVTTRFRFRYKTVAAGSWKTAVDAQALPGQVHGWYQSYYSYKRWRRWEILDNDGHAVRYAAYGNAF